MGAFYGSVLIRTADSEAVHKTLNEAAKAANCKFLVGPPVNGWISVFPDNSGQSENVSLEIARRLAHDIYHLIVHDDDIFAYFFYRSGQLIDRYNSSPDYFQEASEEEKRQCRGRPELFQDLLAGPELLDRVKSLLDAGHDKFTFEQERMVRFVELLTLPNALGSYEYLQSGERDGITGWKQFIHIPDLSAEKNARRAEQVRIKAEKKRLQTEGILLAEITPPKVKGRGLPNSIAWGLDTESHGLVLAWQSLQLTKAIDDPSCAMEFLAARPPWNAPLVPLGLKTNRTASAFCMSPSGDWLAGEFGFGDWKARLWNWRRKELAFEVTHTRAVDWVAFSADEKWFYSLGGEEFIATSMTMKQPVVTIRGVTGPRGGAVHPAGKFVAVGVRDKLGIIDLEKQQLIKTLWVTRRTQIIDFFAVDSQGVLVRQCIETLLENPGIRQKLGVNADLHKAILQDQGAIEKLSAEARQKLDSLIEKVRLSSIRTFETNASISDLRFSPDGKQLFIASDGMQVFDWEQLLAAGNEAPAPKFSVDAPKSDEDDPNCLRHAYSVRFDPDRNLLLCSNAAGVIQYLNVKTGQSGTLLKLLDEVLVWRLELTSDGKALCCHCSARPKLKGPKVNFNCLQVWNYSALCKAAGLD